MSQLPSQIGFDIADVLFAASDPRTSNVETARDFLIMNKGAFSPPINLPFTGYGQAIRACESPGGRTSALLYY